MFYFKRLTSVVFGCICLANLTQAWGSSLVEDSQAPGALAEKAGEKMLNEVRKSGTDKQRWQTFTLYNDDRDPAALRLVLVQRANFVMRLDAKHDLLYFEKPGVQQAFHVSGNSAANQVCPSYDISVIDASSNHAVILQRCIANDAPPGKMHFSRAYYLYDMKTATMINIWYSGDQVRKVPLAFLPPDPIVTTISKGYRVDWHYNDRTVAPPDVVDLHVTYRYVQDGTSKEYFLACKDLTNTQQLEGDICSTVVNMDRKAVSNRRSDTAQ